MSDVALISILQIISLAGSLLTAAKLFSSGLYRRYRWFFYYFLFRIPNNLWPLFLDFRSKSYYQLWLATEPIALALHAGVLLELYRLVLAKHRGLYTLGRWAMLTGITVSAIISLVTLIPRMPAAGSRTMNWYLALERGWMLALAIFLLFMMGFLVLYTVPISANVKVHARIFTIFFISNYLTFLLQSLFKITVYGWTNIIANGVSAACAFAWFFLLSPKKEEMTVSVPIIGPEHERRVLEQLDAFNETLLKISKK